MVRHSAIGRPILAILTCLLISIPFLITQYPPITDLAQHSAQIRLFLETVREPEGSPYRIQWLTPYSLSYLVLGISWAIFGPGPAGRLAMLAIVLLCVIGIHITAWQRNRPAASAALASLFVVNHIVYWGFYSFAIGWPAFLVWFSLTTESRSRPYGVRDAVTWLAGGLLLWASHVLWFAAGVAWLLLHGTVVQRSIKSTAVHVLYLLPLFVGTWFWYPMFSSSSMATPPLWVSTPFDRLNISWLSDAALGGLRGPAEFIVFGGALAWILVGLVQNRGSLGSSLDRDLLLAACMFFLLSIVLPDKYMNTIRFGQRWVPPAMIMLVLAVPAPVFRPVLRRAVAVVAVAAFCAATSLAWLSFEKKELSGLGKALDALPARSRVLGLAFVQESQFIKGVPFIQIFAYSQALKGGALNFSFAEFSPCLVVYKKPFMRAWTGGMEWFPRRVRESDLDHFDYVLIGADDRLHSAWAGHPRISPVTATGRWRLYRILPKPE